MDLHTADRLADAVRRIFGRVLKELADLENPMRSPLGSDEGEGATYGEPPTSSNGDKPAEERPPPQAPELGDPTPPARDPLADQDDPHTAQPDRRRSSDLPSLAPDPDPGEARSRFDADAGVVLYNDRHGDYLLVKEDEGALLDYLAVLVAKEYVVYNNPRPPARTSARRWFACWCGSAATPPPPALMLDSGPETALGSRGVPTGPGASSAALGLGRR